jgi:rRNA processing protein Gar1
MLPQRSSRHQTPACNDNGSFSAIRCNITPKAPNIVGVATEVVGPVTLSYVADSVLILTGL